MSHPVLRDDETGATAVEYGLMIALIAVAISVAVLGFGQAVVDLFDPIIVLVLDAAGN